MERVTKKIKTEKNLLLVFPSSLDGNGKPKEHILEPEDYNKCETLKLLLSVNPLLEEEQMIKLEVNFTTHVIMSWFLEYLRRNFVGLSYEGLIQCILLGDYLGIGDHLKGLFAELCYRTNFCKPLDPHVCSNIKGRKHPRR